MTPIYHFVKADGQTHSVVDPAGLDHAINLVRGQSRSLEQGCATACNLEIVLQAARQYYNFLIGDAE